jgi:phosphatidylinositol alpha-1,6-mannosyltransferase
MKLLCISRKYPPSIGGMQRMNYEIIRRLAAATDATVIKWGGSQLFLIPFLFWALFRSLFLLPRGKRPDIIYLGDALLSPIGFLLKIILRRPVAVTAHGRDLTFRFPLYRTKVGYSIRRLDKVIGVSKYTTELCLAMGVPAERCVTIPNGVSPEEHVPAPEDIEAARKWLQEQTPSPLPSPPKGGEGIFSSSTPSPSPFPSPPLGGEGKINDTEPCPLPPGGEGKISDTEETRGFKPDRPIIMTVGRLVKRKGVARFINDIFPLITASFPKLLYIVVGEGKERRSIEKAIAERHLGGNVILTGQLPDHLIKGLMGLAKVFVMPNVHVPGDGEGFGIAALEASCAGLPVVASGIEGILDAVVDGQNGALISPDEPKRFAAAVKALLTDERPRQDTGERARKFTAEHFGWDTAAGHYLEELHQLLRNPKSQIPNPNIMCNHIPKGSLSVRK